MHVMDILIVDNCIDGEIRPDITAFTFGSYISEVIKGEIKTAAASHVEPLYTEINGIGTGIKGCRQRFSATYRGHYFKLTPFHLAR